MINTKGKKSNLASLIRAEKETTATLIMIKKIEKRHQYFNVLEEVPFLINNI